jgi:hypothetical protein
MLTYKECIDILRPLVSQSKGSEKVEALQTLESAVLAQQTINSQSEQCPRYHKCTLNRGDHCLTNSGWSIAC